MNVNELADLLEQGAYPVGTREQAADMLRQFGLAESLVKQQQLEIEALKSEREIMFGFVKSRGEVGQLIVYKASLEAQEK